MIAPLSEEHVCTYCKERPSDFDGILCQMCARYFGIVNITNWRQTYNNAFWLWNEAGKIYSEKMADKSTPSQTAYLAIGSSPGVKIDNARRLLYFSRLLDKVGDGDIVECGVGTGGTLLALSILGFEQNRNVWGFDSFKGFPQPTPEDESLRQSQEGSISVTVEAIDESGTKTPIKELKDDFLYIYHDMLRIYGLPVEYIRSHITLVNGWFEERLQDYSGDNIALLHLDCDLYESYKVCLETLAPRCTGIIAVDEYMGTLEAANFPGAKLSINEWLIDNGNYWKMKRDRVMGKYYIERRL